MPLLTGYEDETEELTTVSKSVDLKIRAIAVLFSFLIFLYIALVHKKKINGKLYTDTIL